MKFGDERLPEHFWSKVSPEPNTGCWLFVGAQSSAGYGQIRRNSRTLYAHRETYRISQGDHPPGLELDHKCRVRCCCNPDHLEAVSHKDNMRRSPFMVGPLNRRGVAVMPRTLRDSCPCGLKYDKIVPRGNGLERRCSVCKNKKALAAARRRKELK